jgi:hypothetical protein
MAEIYYRNDPSLQLFAFEELEELAEERDREDRDQPQPAVAKAVARSGPGFRRASSLPCASRSDP